MFRGCEDVAVLFYFFASPFSCFTACRRGKKFWRSVSTATTTGRVRHALVHRVDPTVEFFQNTCGSGLDWHMLYTRGRDESTLYWFSNIGNFTYPLFPDVSAFMIPYVVTNIGQKKVQYRVFWKKYPILSGNLGYAPKFAIPLMADNIGYLLFVPYVVNYFLPYVVSCLLPYVVS